MASAQVSLSGDARMGIVTNNLTQTGNTAFSDGTLADAANATSFTSRARVTFTLSGETDTGLAFGGSFRADNSVAAAAGTDGSVFVSGEFGRLTMGNASGAAQFINGHVAGVGLTGLGDLHEMTYLGNPAALRSTARYDYSIDGFAFALSHTNPGNAGKVVSIGASYSFEGFTVGLGAEQQNATAGVDAVDGAPATLTTASVAPAAAVAAVGQRTHIVASLGYTMDNITVKATYGRLQTAARTVAQNAPGTGVAIAKSKADQYALSATGTFDAITVTAFGKRDFIENTHIGLGASYDLGGGASLVGGVVNTNFKAAGQKNRTQADFGLAFTF